MNKAAHCFLATIGGNTVPSLYTLPDGSRDRTIESLKPVLNVVCTITAKFKRDLEGSDFLHWGEGEVYIHEDRIAHKGALSRGPITASISRPNGSRTRKIF